MDSNEKEIIEERLGKLSQLAFQRDQIEREIGRNHLAVRGLLHLVGDDTKREAYKAILESYAVRISVTDLITMAIKTIGKPLTPAEIRDFIVNYGSEASNQQNLLQSIHTLLKRMQESNRIKETTNDDGEKAFRVSTLGERILGTIPGVSEAEANKVGQSVEKSIPLSSLLKAPILPIRRVAIKDKKK